MGAGERGQAAVEWVGVVVAVALAVGALALWLPRAVEPPRRLPDPVAAIARPLDGLGATIEAMSRAAPPRRIPAGRDDEPIGRALRRGASGALTTVEIGVRTRLAFERAYARRLAEHARGLLRDPLWAVVAVARAEPPRPGDFLAAAARRAREARAYARRLRGMPLEQAMLELADDAGRLAADATVEGAKVAVRRRVTATMRRRPPDGGPPPARRE